VFGPPSAVDCSYNEPSRNSVDATSRVYCGVYRNSEMSWWVVVEPKPVIKNKKLELALPCSLERAPRRPRQCALEQAG
jgi:hypothetical protein